MDLAAFATYAFVASRSAVFDPAGFRAVFESIPDFAAAASSDNFCVSRHSRFTCRSVTIQVVSDLYPLPLFYDSGILIVPAGILIVRDQWRQRHPERCHPEAR